MAVQNKMEYFPWVEKHRPSKLEEFIGNREEVIKLENWLKTWNQQRKKVVLLAGPAGVGKTSVVHYLINKYNYEYVEVNASDKRNKKAVERLVGMSSTEGTVLQGSKVRKLILVDEADGLFGNQDRGGGSALAKAIDNARIPIICTANDPSASSLKKAKRKMLVIEFSRLKENEVLFLLKQIILKEKVDVEEKILIAIAKNSGGDARSAINDLESIAFGEKIEDVVFSPRNQLQSLDIAMNKIFQAQDFVSAKRATDDADVDYRELLMYVYEHAYKQAGDNVELFNMYELIAEADLYLSQCYRTQNWVFLKYFFTFISSVGLVKNSPFKYTKFGFPSYWALMGRLRSKTAKMRKLAQKSIKKLHCSEKQFEKEIYPYIRIIFNSDPKMAAGLAVWLQYDDDDLDFLTSGSKKIISKIKAYSEEAYVQMSEKWIEKGKETIPTTSLLDFSRRSLSKKQDINEVEKAFEDLEEGDEVLKEIKAKDQEEPEKVVDKESEGNEESEGKVQENQKTKKKNASQTSIEKFIKK